VQADAVQEGMTLLDEFFGGTSLTRIDFDRTKADSFSACITPCHIGGEACLSEEEALNLAPAGSNWKAAEGWRSFFGHMLQTKVGQWFIVGVEGVVPHEQRGAYPVLRAYAFRFDEKPLKEMQELACRLYEGPSLVGGCWGVMRTHSKTPGDHRKVEGKIMGLAASSYRDHPTLLFRTLILCPSRLPRKYPLSSLVATVPTIQRTFSLRDLTWCTLNLRLHFRRS
jgi:hypothetical protein